jgi:sugar phosphate isomerase/epimerase
MDTAVLKKFPGLLARAELESLAQLGYSGVGPAVLDAASWDHLVQRVVPWCKELRLEIPAVYTTLRVTSSASELDPELARHISGLASCRSTIWLQINGEGLPASSQDADRQIVDGIRQASVLAKQIGTSVSLYPHYGTLIQTIPDALRIIEKVSRDNVGLTFNLCHFLRGEPHASPADTLKAASPHLQIVTLCGANQRGSDWKELIQPLDQGDFNLSGLLALLDKVRFQGPIGLQGYDVAHNFNIEPQTNLARSLAAWRKIALVNPHK